jgi:hypothetical protein
MNARQMRVSDSERERVAQFLREQSLEGRLDHDELEERLGAAYRAKTAGELEDLIEDLPHRRVARPPSAPRPPRHVPAARRHHSGPPVPLLVLAVFIGLLTLPAAAAGGLALVVALTGAFMVAVFVLGFAFGPFILLGLIISRAFRRRPPGRHWTPRY